MSVILMLACRRRLSVENFFFQNMCKPASCLHHLLPPLATFPQFLGYVPAHHFLAQLHEQKSLKKFESSENFALNKNINHL